MGLNLRERLNSLAQWLGPGSWRDGLHYQRRRSPKWCPPITLTGVLHPTLIHSTDITEYDDDLTFYLVAWRVNGGEINTELVAMRAHGSPEGLSKLLEGLEPWTILSFRCQFSRLMEPANCLGPMTRPEDRELELLRDDLMRDVTLDHPVLGPLALEHEHTYFTGSTTWMGQPIGLTVNGRINEPKEGVCDLGAMLVQGAESFDTRFRAAAEDQLYDLYLSEWRDPDLPIKERDEFRNMLMPRELVVWESKTFELSYDAGELFYGHDVSVGSSDGGVTLEVHL